ncbi:molybdenum cofactor guanylyltransferase MobA [Neorhizobium alkalisoli]|uniref:Molybdenum cofactor guanylyltransferase n=1 Tax=Neorhizobium alkalisoli TaxID=528178 RepID=A0A561QH90_9HYPH|nr:molybdenum cofactor guanylyltransferase MobA [Neorhizobium alkalisoli]TWF49743.1 molybdenum cofactor guanylyltransferase [Neorhizobium alkalisoli]
MSHPAPIPGLVLAGGRSSRMGENKAMMALGDRTILGHVIHRLSPQVPDLALNAPADFPETFGLRLVPDRDDDRNGPLEGVLCGLLDLRQNQPASPFLMTVPCDSPFLPLDLAARLSEKATPGTIVIAASEGRSHPVFGLWPVTLAQDLENWLANPDNRRINAFLNRHPVETVEFPMIETGHGPLDPFMNINTREDLALAKTFIGTLE